MLNSVKQNIKNNTNEFLIAINISLITFNFCFSNLFFRTSLFMIIELLIGAVSYIIAFKQKPLIPFGFFCVFLVLVLYSYSINGEKFIKLVFSFYDLVSFSKTKLFLLIFLYCPILILCLTKKIYLKYFFDLMGDFSIILIILLLLLSIKILTGLLIIDYMTISYLHLFWMFFLFYKIKQSRKKICTLLLIASSFCVCLGGSRGALICLIIFYILTFFFDTKIESTYKIRLFLFFIAVIAIFVNFYGSIALFFSNVLKSFGYSSRIIEEMLNGTFFHYDDRYVLQSKILQHILDYPLGSGIYGDRLYNSEFVYIHNWILEFFMDYGVYFGTLLILFVILLIVHLFTTYFKNNSLEIYVLLCFSIVLLFIKYMISGSYLESQEFMLTLGLTCNIMMFRVNKGELLCKTTL